MALAISKKSAKTMNKMKRKALSYLLILSLFVGIVGIVNVNTTYAASKKDHLKRTAISVVAGKTYQQKLIGKNGKTIKASKVKWKSSKPSVAKINKKGKITGVKVGTVKMTAKYKGKTYKFKVKVKKPFTLSLAVNLDDGTNLGINRTTITNLLKPSPYAAKIPVLMFHRIVSDNCKKDYYPDNEWVASVSDLKKEMKYLYDNQYETISLQDFERWYDGEIEVPKKTVVLTFDDGDYEIYYLIYPVLKEYGFQATFFIIGSKTEEKTYEYIDNRSKHYIGKDLINTIQAECPKLQFQSHSYDLHYKTSDGKCAASIQDYDKLDLDFKQNIPFDFTYIAYPYGYYNNDLIQAAKANGMGMGFAAAYHVNTCATRNDNRYAIPRVAINGQISFDQYVNLLQNFLDD